VSYTYAAFVTLRSGTGRQKMGLERWTYPKLSRRTCTCENGLQSCRGESAGVAKRPRERSPTRNPSRFPIRRRGLSLHNVVKSFYLPMLFRPAGFAHGLRVLFGDQVIFCRRREFEAIQGFDASLPIMEDADLCVRLHHPAQTQLHQLPGERTETPYPCSDGKVANRTLRISGGRPLTRPFRDAEFPLQHCSPYSHVHVRRESVGVVPRFVRFSRLLHRWDDPH
jgi:hypothetical protein